MRLQTLVILLILCAGSAISQNAAFPLESVTIEGSSIPRQIVLEIAALKIAAPIDKSGMEQACMRLQESGLFPSITYRYAPGPKKGYALTLALADQTSLSDAAIDVPGVDEREVWQWLSTKFRGFDRQVPQAEAAQKYLAGEIERHIGSGMRGQRLTVRMEADFRTGKSWLLFQPEVLPRLQSVAFTGNQAVESKALSSVLDKVAVNAEYTDRKFAGIVDLNLRPVYEERGYYRARFEPGAPQWSEAGVSLTLGITEGAPYQLGNVEIVGADLPVNAMISAARFPKGKLANWKQIQVGIWELEKVVKQTGFYEATASADRSYDDVAHVLDLRIHMRKGPLYRLGEVRIVGLSPDLEGRAKQLWKPKPGDPYNYAYPNEFFEAFSRAVDFGNFRKYSALPRKGAGDYVMDVNVVFEPR